MRAPGARDCPARGPPMRGDHVRNVAGAFAGHGHGVSRRVQDPRGARCRAAALPEHRAFQHRRADPDQGDAAGDAGAQPDNAGASFQR